MKICIIIPAHLASVRLNEKILHDINGLPMIEHVRRRLSLLKNKVDIFVATPNDTIKNTVESNGGNIIMTNEHHKNGTSRVIEASQSLDYDFYLIVQGDEPLLLPNEIDELIDYIKKEKPEVVNVTTRIGTQGEFNDRNTVKCFVNEQNTIQLFFRCSPFDIEFTKQEEYIKKVQGYIGIHSHIIKHLMKSEVYTFVEDVSIEQLLFNIQGIEIKSFEFEKNLPTVNTKEDLHKVISLLENDIIQQKIFKKIANSA